MLGTRYRGLRLLLGRWEGRGFSRDLKNLLRYLEAGNAERAEMEVMDLVEYFCTDTGS